MHDYEKIIHYVLSAVKYAEAEAHKAFVKEFEEYYKQFDDKYMAELFKKLEEGKLNGRTQNVCKDDSNK